MPDQFLHGVEVVQIDDGIRPIRTVKSSVVGIVGTAPDADAAAFPAETPVLVKGPRHAAGLGATGTLKDAYNAVYAQGVDTAVVIRVEEGADAAATAAAVAGAVETQTGVWALLTAKAVTGQEPRILVAPGFANATAIAPTNPAIDALVSIADRLRAVVICDGPNTTEADAIAAAALYGTRRLYMVDPHVRAFDADDDAIVTRPASGYAAGVLSRTDQERGFWWSPSNQLMRGLSDTARPISFHLSSRETEANRLNEAKVATVINDEGFRLWGNRTTSSDALWAFLPVVRTADMIYESLEVAHRWALDRPFSAQLLLDIQESVAAYLRTLTARGAILGGRVWLDPELNTETELKAGKLYVNFDIEPPAPLEHLTFRAYRNGEYYEELVEEVALAAS
jgi:phage tail sheath protein FI